MCMPKANKDVPDTARAFTEVGPDGKSTNPVKTAPVQRTEQNTGNPRRRQTYTPAMRQRVNGANPPRATVLGRTA